MKILDYRPGEKISEPGIYRGVPMRVYHGQPCEGPSVSSSGLRKIFSESLAHFWVQSSLNPDREQEERPTEAMVLGSGAHHLLLGEADFDKHFVVRPARIYDRKTGKEEAWNGNRGACREWLVEQELRGITVLTEKQVEQIRGMSKSLAEEPMVQGGILNGLTELSFFWPDPETGIWLKWRPDNMPEDSLDFFDLKCVSDISDAGINKSISDFGYFQQGALGCEALESLLGAEMSSFALVFVESSPPHCVRVEALDADDLALGRQCNRAALRLLASALEDRSFPGPKNRAGDGNVTRMSQRSREWIEHRLSRITEIVAA